MALKFQRWKLSGELSPNQYDDNSCIITITGLPAGWSWEAFLNHGDSLDIIPLDLDESGTIARTILKKEQLAFSGLYTIQLRGNKEEITQHTNKLEFTVGDSFSEAAHWPEIPDAFNKYVQSVADNLSEKLDVPGAVQKYLEENPVTVTEKDPTVPDWAKTETKPTYTADEVGAIAESELQTAINTALAQAKASGEFDGADGKSAYQYAVEGGYTGTEAEFAAKLAREKFANPNALTFTGAISATYDGSAPVSVEIPSGGGGSSVLLDNLTVINSMTIAEETQYIYLDIDYSLYKCICFSVSPATNGTHIFYVGFTDNAKTNALNGGTLYNKATGLVVPLSETAVFFSWNTGKGKNSEVSRDINNAEGVAFFDDNITGLRLYNNDKWQAGDVIAIYGEVR